MKAEGWNQSQLARAAGTGRGTVGNWVNNETYQHMDAEYAFNIADKSRSRFNARWIYDGEGPQMQPPEPSADEQSVLKAYRELSTPRREALAALLKP